MPRRKTTSRRSRRPAGGAGHKVRSLVRREITRSVETKTSIVAASSTGVSDSPYFANLCVVGQGDGAADRDGNSVSAVALRMRGMFQAETADSFNIMRVMLVKAKSSTALVVGDLPADIFVDTRKTDNLKYTVLYDRTFALNSVDGSYSWTKTFSWNYNLKRSKVMYSGAGTAPVGGGYYLWAVTDSTVINHPDIAYSASFDFQG